MQNRHFVFQSDGSAVVYQHPAKRHKQKRENIFSASEKFWRNGAAWCEHKKLRYCRMQKVASFKIGLAPRRGKARSTFSHH
jgi:hypothetical protein